MEIDGARVLVCGASGALGGMLADRLLEQGARVVAAGRQRERLVELAGRCGTEPVVFDAVDGESCRAAVGAAVDQLGGLDALVVTVGAPAFGRAVQADDAVVEELFAVNVLGPMALVRAAAPALAEGGTVVVFSAILADAPTNEMAEYSASKSALSAWLGVLRREERRRFAVVDVRPPHLDTGLEGRALSGDAPASLPEPSPATDVVDAVLTAMSEGRREVVWDPKGRGLVVH